MCGGAGEKMVGEMADGAAGSIVPQRPLFTQHRLIERRGTILPSMPPKTSHLARIKFSLCFYFHKFAPVLK